MASKNHDRDEVTAVEKLDSGTSPEVESNNESAAPKPEPKPAPEPKKQNTNEYIPNAVQPVR